MNAPDDVTEAEGASLEDLRYALQVAATGLAEASRIADALHVRGVVRYVPGVVEGAKRSVAHALDLIRED